MEQQFDLQNILSVLRRRYLYLIIPAALVFAGAAAVAYILPPIYQASATILVESQQIPTDLASPTVTSAASERIRVIEQRLMTRDNLFAVASKFNLYQYLGPDVSPTEVVENMRGAIEIQQIANLGATSRNNTGVVGFTVSFSYRNNALASQVTTELVNSILSQNVETRLSRASETSTFFQQQKDSLERRLLELEHKLAEFKQANESVLPETLSIRREQLLQVQLQISDIEQRIRLASGAGVSPVLGSSGGGAQQLGYTLQARQLELDSYRDQRAELGPLAEQGVVPANRIRDLDRQIAVAEINIEAIRAQIAASGGTVGAGPEAVKQLEEEKSQLEQRAQALNDGIVKTPLVQVQLNAMERDYQNLQAEYRQAQAKLESALTGERLEEDRQAERFEVIEQAVVPDRPVRPDRPRIMIGGAAGGLALGGGLLVLRQMLDKSVYTPAGIEKALQLRPIGTIPYVSTRRERRWKRSRVLLILLALVGVVVAALVLIDMYYMPLDLVIQRITDSLKRLM